MTASRLLAASAALCLAAACYTEPDSPADAPPAATANDINIVVGAEARGAEAFSPNPKTVALAGAPSVTVRWVNMDVTGGDIYTEGDAVIHDIVSSSDPAAFPPSGNLGGNETYSIELTAPGDYPYHSSLHPGMTGTIHVDP